MIGNPKVLIVPGWMGSGPQHWQTYWEQRHPEYRRMALSDWRNVHRQDWVRAVEMAVLSAGDGVVLVAHSLGCLATIWWAASGFAVAGRIHAAMLVAPPDLCSAPGCLPALPSFARCHACGCRFRPWWWAAKPTRSPAWKLRPRWRWLGKCVSEHRARRAH